MEAASLRFFEKRRGGRQRGFRRVIQIAERGLPVHW
jgi:hypothetical protein